MARAITGNGRYYIQLMANYIEKGLQELLPSSKPYIVYGDTDSNYFFVEPFVKKAFENNADASITDKVDFCDNLYNDVIDKFVQKSITDFCKEYNAYNQAVIGSAREIISDKAIWTAKKKYIARVFDSEGVRYSEPKIKVMGLDLIRSGTPPFVKKKLKESIDIILDSNESTMTDWKDKSFQEYMKQPLNDISKIQGVSSIDYVQGQKGIPIGARSAMKHNAFIKKNNLENEIQIIQAGDKIHQMYLKEPNIFGSNIIAWTSDNFIKHIEEANCVNYELCFEKYFLAPLQLMTDALKWNITKTTQDLDDW